MGPGHHVTSHVSLARLLSGPPRAVCRSLPALVFCQGSGLLTSAATLNCTSASSWASSDVRIFCASACNWRTPEVRATRGRSLTLLPFSFLFPLLLLSVESSSAFEPTRTYLCTIPPISLATQVSLL